jgi:hypothetical protein
VTAHIFYDTCRSGCSVINQPSYKKRRNGHEEDKATNYDEFHAHRNRRVAVILTLPVRKALDEGDCTPETSVDLLVLKGLRAPVRAINVLRLMHLVGRFTRQRESDFLTSA